MTVPMAVLSVVSPQESSGFVVLSLIGNFSLFPLLFEDRETVVKCLLLLCGAVVTFISLARGRTFLKFSVLQKLLMTSVPLIFVVCDLVIPRLWTHLPFLPLLIYSLFSSIAVSFEYLKMYIDFCNIE